MMHAVDALSRVVIMVHAWSYTHMCRLVVAGAQVSMEGYEGTISICAGGVQMGFYMCRRRADTNVLPFVADTGIGTTTVTK